LARTAAPAVPLIRDSGISLDKAEVKNRISDLYVALADLKMEAADVREPRVQKDAGIAELAALELKPILVRQNDGYYEKDENGNPRGDSFCPRCWELDHRALHLARADHNSNYCPTCKAVYTWDRTHPMK
jgi:hypothetical protein